jgi:cytochrome c556
MRTDNTRGPPGALGTLFGNCRGDRSMLRSLFILAAIALFGASVASAQSCDDVIAKRQDLMKGSGAAGKEASSIMKGEAPFDLAKAKEILAAFAADADAMPTLFPDCSKSGDHTTASPAIWDKADDFKAAMAKFSADVKAAQESTKDIDTFKTGVQSIGKNCSNCHQNFRVRPS